MKDIRLCVIAYACEPGKGSEPEVGWRWSLALSKIAKVTVITRSNNKVNIERELNSIISSSLKFEYVDLPKWMIFWKKKGRFVHLYYILWQVLAVTKAYVLHRQLEFDAVVHVTFSPYYHSPLAALLPIKFIWGPVGAGEMIPSSFLPMFTRKQRLRELLRDSIRILSRFDPTFYFCCIRASKIIAATPETREIFPKWCKKKIVLEGQLGEVVRREKQNGSVQNNFTFITSGRQEYWKGHILVLKAFNKFIQKFEVKNTKLIVLSDGKEGYRLHDYVHEQQLDSLVTFTGWLAKRDETFKYYLEADVFLYASLFECGGYVVVEAINCGLPVICVDLGGPGDSIDSTCGIKVPATCPVQVVNDMAAAMYKLYENRELCAALSKGAFERVENWFDWEKKEKRIERILQDILCSYQPIS